MPKINRLRIVNFSFNNNKRHIQDETFDFYGGENVLFSLVNGGGKSVLVQAMLQPILPKATLLRRKVGDFFVGRNTPSYIMIEWKLDDDAGYLLSGISIMPSVSHSTIEEEQTTNIRFYTFIHEYGTGNSLDIKNIPVTEPLGNHLKISSYNDFRKFMRKEEEKAPYKIGVFSSERDDQRKYERKLGSYGVYIDEWKELIVKINEAEHGVSEVFTRCKTSKMVMEQWVIKYIEDVLNKSSTEHSDHDKLQTMMSQVAESLVENEHHLIEYERISSFISDSEELYGETKAILSSLDDEMKRKKNLRTSLHVLTTEESKLEGELQNLEHENTRLSNEIKRIELEKKSLEIYKYIEELEKIEEELAYLKDKQNQKEVAHQEAGHNLAIQKAAERLQVISEKKQRLASLNERLANAEKKEEQLARDLNQVKFSLKLAYERVLEVSEANIKSYGEAQDLHNSRIAELKKEIDESQTKLRGLERDLGGLNIEIRRFEEEESAVFEKLGMELYRNPLIRELDPKDIESASNKLEGALSNIQEQIQNTDQEIKNTEDEIARAEKEREELAEKQLVAQGELSEVVQVIKGYEEKRKDILSILKAYNIAESELFDREFILKRINEKKNSWESKSLSLRMSINDADKLLNGIEEGISYMPPRLVTMLKEHNLPCYTGEQYLKDLDDPKREALLEQNPLLPYALILTEKEYSQIAELLTGEELSQIVPILRYQDRETITIENGSLESDKSEIRFFASARMMEMNADDRSAYIHKLEESKGALLAELESATRVLEDSNREYQAIFQFTWSKEKVDSLYQARSDLDELLLQYENKANLLKQLIGECRKDQKSLVATRDGLEKDSTYALQNIEVFKEYLSDNDRYMENLAKASNINGEISRTQTRDVEIKDEVLNEEKKLKDVEERLSQEKRNKRDVESKYDRVKDANEVETLKENLNELEGQLEAYQKEQSSEVSDIRDNIDNLNKDIRTENRQLQKLGLAPDEYENVVYNEEIEAQLEADIKAFEKEINSFNYQYIENDKHKTKVETLKGEVEKALDGEPLVPASEIRGDFDARIIKFRNQIQVNKVREGKIQKLFIRIRELVTMIQARIPEVMSIELDSAATSSFSEVDVAVEDLIRQYKANENETNQNISHFNKKFTDLKTEYQQEQAGVVYEAFKSIQAQVDGLSRSYDKYYYLSERLDSCIVKLGEVLKIMEEKVLQLEHDQKDLVEHAFMEAMRIYREIPKVSENSSVMIDGVRKKILEIQFDKVEDELAAREKMAVYIKGCLDTLTKIIKDKEDSNRNRQELKKFISTKELLNVISSLESYVIKAYKVDLNEKNRRMMPWEDIIIKNSGGEKFVAYFSLLSALIAYSRGRNRDSLLKKEDSKVLIMDNPFGPITSGHLLKPMFDIAEKYNTQLICLSDIKQGSVLERFKLIYMVKIRQNMMQDDYLEFEPHAFADLKADEKLENAHIYSSTQIGFID